jgi:hypothetical protein
MQRIRGYLTGESARRDFAELWPTVVAARLRLLDTIERVTQAQAEWKPAGEEWSIVEVTRHALNASRDVLRVIEGLAAGERASRSSGPGAQPEDAPHDIAELRRLFTAHSVHFAALPDRVPPAPNLALTAPHAFFGELNCRGWFLFQEIHDADHINQIGKITAAPGYPAS